MTNVTADRQIARMSFEFLSHTKMREFDSGKRSFITNQQLIKLEGRFQKLLTVRLKKLYDSKLCGLLSYDDVTNSLCQRMWWNQGS